MCANLINIWSFKVTIYYLFTLSQHFSNMYARELLAG